MPIFKKCPGHLVFVSLKKEHQNGMLTTKGYSVKSTCDSELQTNGKITGTCREQLNNSLWLHIVCIGCSKYSCACFLMYVWS